MKKIIAGFIACVALAACSKDNGGTTSCTLSSTSIVGKYKITAVTFDGADAMSQIPACNQDDVYELKSDGTATVTDAGTQCSPSSDQSGTWSLNGTTLTTSNAELSGTVSDFSCTGLKINGTQTIGPISGATVITLVRQ
ncbi:lipocalin-like domain-containing protein [Ferruginibacter albus]|uniref:lipocalin family protein n=1 Tax=Ferruginibacter albus TaxID=2875540 RepID=UPI001CC36E8C|nr:lipocalin family protein [Ferruginibacter albus]UAY53284.1 lipocalin family protein [Ferruginibacter albus]